MTTRETPIGVGRAFFGPPRTRAEAVLGVGGGAVAMALLAAYIRHAGGWQDWSTVQMAVAAVFGADLIGGIFTISAPTSSRWYHRPGAAAKRFRVGFVLAHAGIYLAPVAAVFGLGWGWMLANSVVLVGSAAVIESVPAALKRMVAIGLALAAALAGLIWLPTPAAVAWLPVLLFVKVLVCFSVPGVAAPSSHPID
ncbi:hypothetical protein ACAG26_22530 [Mycobacterium sp. pUA109]|uniref:hypothetical protein n=1 Tax=Mycobacterium sp. pUA109 TaxID=3238982 RepID=UPI00351B1E4B